MLKYDSQHGQFKGTIEVKEDGLTVNGKEVKFYMKYVNWRADVLYSRGRY